MNNVQDSLGQFGTSYQTKVLSVLVHSREFLQQVSDITHPRFFSSEASQWISEQIISYFRQYKQPPTLDALKHSVSQIQSEILKVSVIEALRAVYRGELPEDVDFIKDSYRTFCKNQELKAAILESVDLLQHNQFDQIKKRIDDAMKVGLVHNLGHNYVEDVEERYAETRRQPIATPWPVINDIMQGGLSSGELGVIVAPPGIGKSMGLVNLAAYAVQQGHKVIYYTLELASTYVGLRFDSYYTGIPSTDLKYHKEVVVEAVGKLKGSFIIQQYPTKTITLNAIAAHIEQCATTGFTPDLIIVDYADLIKDTGSSKTARYDQMLGNLYEELRGLAGTYKVPIWTASQSNRSSAEEEVIEGDKISESYAKLMVADFVMSLSRKMADKALGTGRWHVIKNRLGPDGITFPSKLNMAAAHITIFAENTSGGQEAKQLMNKGDEVTRMHLATKFQEFKSFL